MKRRVKLPGEEAHRWAILLAEFALFMVFVFILAVIGAGLLQVLVPGGPP